MIREQASTSISTPNFFPMQMLSEKEKSDQYYMDCVDSGLAIVNWNLNLYSSIGVRNTRKNKQINYNLFNDVVDKEEMNRVINPWGFDDVAQLPRYKNYSLVNSSLMLLFGEERRRMFNPVVSCINNDAISEKLQTITSQFTNLVAQSLISPNESQEETERKMQEFGKWQMSYKDRRARMAQQVIDYLMRTERISETFSKGFEDLLIAGEEIYFADIVGSKPVLRRGNPLNVYSLRGGTSHRIEDSDIIVEDGYLPLGEVLDRYYDDLKPDEIEALQRGFKVSTGKGMIQGQEANPVFDPSLLFGVELAGNVYSPTNQDVSYFAGGFDVQGNVRTTRVLWKGMRKIGVLESPDPETGESTKSYVDETYKVNKAAGETIEWIWVSEWYEGVKIGTNVYVRCKPCPFQIRSMDNPSICHHPVVGTVVNVNANKGRSLMDMTREYQYFYNALMTRLEMTMVKDKGRIPVLDLSMIPDSFTIDKWMYFADVLGWAVKDPFNEGTKGASMGKLAGGMNQNSNVIDMSQGDYMQRIISMADFVRARVEDITGINSQRKGAIDNRETVGGVERAVTQSSMSTEKWFSIHDDTKIRALKLWLEAAKVAWKGEKFKRPYLMDDGTMGVLDFNWDDFAEAEYGIDITSSSRDEDMVRSLQSLSQAFLQNGGSMAIVADLYRTTDPQSLQRKIEAYEQQIKEDAQQAQQAQLQQQQQQMQQDAQLKQQELDSKHNLEMAKLELERFKIEQDSATKIQVAQINSYMRSENKDLDNNGIPDPLEIGKAALDKQKVDNEANQKHLDMLLKYQTEGERLDVEREKMQHEKELQEQKDAAALEREKLKAKMARQKVTSKK